MIEKVQVETLTADSSTLQTAELLGLVYNGGSAGIKEIECANHCICDRLEFRSAGSRSGRDGCRKKRSEA